MWFVSASDWEACYLKCLALIVLVMVWVLCCSSCTSSFVAVSLSVFRHSAQWHLPGVNWRLSDVVRGCQAIAARPFAVTASPLSVCPMLSATLTAKGPFLCNASLFSALLLRQALRERVSSHIVLIVVSERCGASHTAFNGQAHLAFGFDWALRCRLVWLQHSLDRIWYVTGWTTVAGTAANWIFDFC